MVQRGQSTLEWVIGAAEILGTFTSQRNPPLNQGRRGEELRDELARYRPLEIIDEYLEVAVPALDAR